jgi:hemolysin III
MSMVTGPRYTVGEEIANSVTHGIGWLLSVAGLVTLVTFATITGGTLRVVSCTIFGVTLVVLYAASTLYHALPNRRAKGIFRVLDHSAIFLLIAGTYTPLVPFALAGAWGWSLLACVWLLALAGVLLNTLAPGRWRRLSVSLYLAMGWLAVVAIKPFIAAFDHSVVILIVAGGLAYTWGLAFYLWRGLKYGHALWHIFVLAGSVLHYFAVFFAVGIG